MAKGLQEWLAAFIATELQAVIDWHSSGAGLESQPDSRFSDDGSNFRGFVSSPPLSLETKLQLTEILAHDHTALVTLSDGAHSVRASLSKDAIAVLQSEIEEKLGPQTTGDVFAVTAATVTSTPYGGEEGWIQLQIDDIQYAHHLRKTAGNPVPVTQHERVASLLEHITKLRQKQYGDADEVDEEPSSQLAASQVNGTSIVPSQTFATQAPAIRKKKSAAPSLMREGFEVNPGINLNRPTVASYATSKRLVPANGQAGPSTTKSARLLGLLGGPRAAPASEPLALPPTQPAEPSRVEVTPQKDVPTALAVVEISIDAAASPALASPSGTADEHADSPPTKKRRVGGLPDSPKRLPYGRRKIPEIQQRLLDRKDSWLPSLPGYTYPEPNVPIELLRVWNEKMKGSGEKASPVRSSRSVAKSPSKPASSGAERRIVGQTPAAVETESSDSDTSSDEPFGASQWSPSPPPAASALPPDSTMDSDGAASQRHCMHGSPMKAPTASRALRQSPNSLRLLNGSPPARFHGSPNSQSEGPSLAQSSVTRSLPVRSPTKSGMRPAAHPSDDSPRASGSLDSVFKATRRDAKPSTHPSNQGSPGTPTPRSSFDRRISGASMGSSIEPKSRERKPSQRSAEAARIPHSPHESPGSTRPYDSYRSDGSDSQRERPQRRGSRSFAETPRGPRASLSSTHSPRYSDLYRPSPSQPHTQWTVGPPGTTDTVSPYTRYWDERSTAPKRPTPMRHPLPPRPPPPASDIETSVTSAQASSANYSPPVKHTRSPKGPPELLVKSTQPMVIDHEGTDERDADGGEDADAMEVDVPRPLQDPAEAHREKRRQHMRAAQRRTWLKNTCDFVKPPRTSSDPAPTQTDIASWASIIHTAYCDTHQNDPAPWHEFRQAIKDCFPGYDKVPRCGVSFKVGGKKTGAAASQHHGTTVTAGNDTSRIVGSGKPREKGKGKAKAEDSVRSTDDDAEMMDDAADDMGADGRVAEGAGEGMTGRGEVHPRPRPPTGTESAEREDVAKAVRGPMQRPRQPSAPPATAFGEFVEAWRSVKPGGAFAKPAPNGARKQRPPMDVLSWNV